MSIFFCIVNVLWIWLFHVAILLDMVVVANSSLNSAKPLHRNCHSRNISTAILVMSLGVRDEILDSASCAKQMSRSRLD